MKNLCLSGSDFPKRQLTTSLTLLFTNFILLFHSGMLYAQQPSNNSCSNAQNIVLPNPGQFVNVNGTTVGATASFGNSFWACTPNGQDVWYKFTTSNSVTFSVDFIRGSIGNGVEIKLFSQCPPGGYLGYFGCQTTDFSFTLNLQPNTTYYMLVYNGKSGSNIGQGTFQMNFNNPTTLPVELISFTSECKNNDVEVKWSTASEHNSHSFVLQVSEDGTNWSDLEKTDAAGFSNTNVDYAYLHQNASRTKSYYRLLQYDNDGAMKMYNIIMANCSSDEAVFMTFPNPSVDAFTVVVNDELLSGANILTISDASGKVLYSIAIELENGSGSFALEDLDLPAGLYYLQLNNGSHTSRVIKHSFR